MGATSITGKGPGSAEGSSKGPKERNFVGVEKLIGPRVMMAGIDTLVAGLAGGEYTVSFPNPLPCVTPLSAAANPPTPEMDYVILVHDRTDGSNAVTITTTNCDADGDVTVPAAQQTHLYGFTMFGIADDIIDWVVIKVGNA
jgi:hypothetical protein